MTIYDPLHDCKLIGATRAICGIRDSAVIAHSRPGCQSGAALLRGLSSQQDDMKIICSGLKGKEMALGGDFRVSAAVEAVWKHLHPGLIAVLNCSAPSIMGDDIHGAVAAVQEDIQAPVMALEAAGYEGPDWMGYEEALAALVGFMTPAAKKTGTINLIGFKDDQPMALADLAEIKRMLGALGVGINTVLTACSFEAVKRVPQAALNVVLGGDGLSCANRIGELFDIPKVMVPYPFGMHNTIDFLEKICAGLGKAMDRGFIALEQQKIKKGIERIYYHLQGLVGMPVAIVGEAGRVRDFAVFACDEMGVDARVIAISSANGLDWEREKQDGRFSRSMLVTPDKFEMDQKIASAGVELIFGSTMERKLAHELDAGLMRISFPVLDMVSISSAPYAGFTGVLHLLEATVNTIISRPEKDIQRK